MPFVKQELASQASQLLSEKLGCKVEIKDVYLRLFNHLDLQNVAVYDQQQCLMLKSSHIGAKLTLNGLLDNKIQINHLELFNTQCNLYRENDETSPNFQFVIDSLGSKNPEDEAGPDLIINTLIVRDLSIQYDVKSSFRTPQKFNPDHLAIEKFDANLRINSLTADSINLRVRDIALKEHSGLNISSLAFQLVSGKNDTKLLGLKLKMPKSQLQLTEVKLHHASNKWNDILNGTLEGTKLNGEINPSDMGALLPQLAQLDDELYTINATVGKNTEDLNVSAELSRRNNPQLFSLTLGAALNTKALQDHHTAIHCDIDELNVKPDQIKSWAKAFGSSELPDLIDRIDAIHHNGTIDVFDKKIETTGITKFANGSITENVELNDDIIDAKIETQQLDLGTLLNSQELGILNSKTEINGNIAQKDLKFSSLIENAVVNNYQYKNIKVTGNYAKEELAAKLEMDDENARLKVDGLYLLNNTNQPFDVTMNIAHLNPSEINLTKAFGNATLSGDIDINCESLSPTLLGQLRIDDFKIKKDTMTCNIDSIKLSITKLNNRFYTIVNSDVLDGSMISNVDHPALLNAVKEEINKHVQLFENVKETNNETAANFNIDFKRTELLEQMFKFPLHIEENARINGNIDTESDKLRMTASFPSFQLNGTDYKNGSLFFDGKKDSIKLLTQITKHFNKDNVKLELNAAAHNNTIASHIKWKDIDNDGFRGDLSALTEVSIDKDNKGVQIKLYPSNVLIDDSVWTIKEASLDLRDNDFNIHNFHIGHKNQYISMHSLALNEGGRVLAVKLNDIDLDYIFNLLDFHPVYFGGKASGDVLTTDLNEKKDFNANLIVKDFTFNRGDMGTLHLKGGWRDDEKRVLLDAITQRSPKDSTLIKGFVDIDEDRLDLKIDSRQTNLQFLNFYLGSIFKDITGYCNGSLRVYGPLDSINIAGDEALDSLRLFTRVLNTPMVIVHDSLRLRPGRLIFDNVKMYDAHHQSLTINGEVTHRVLHDFRFDFNFNFDNALIFDWKDYETSGFWGTVYAGGNAQLKGTPDDVHLNANVTPRKKTVFVYDSSNSDASDTKEFISFKNPLAYITSEKQRNKNDQAEENDKIDDSANTYLNLNINAVPDADFTILTDNKTGDNMNLNGSGNLHINYYNKGKFMMYGIYTLDHGTYKITIQDIIRKNFKMQAGGTLRFNGAPFDGDINMIGKYNVSSVSLSDLNLGGNMSNSTTSVDCILNFKGKAGSPEVSFDIDFPSVGTDERNMVRNIISSQGDMTMQVIYLLSVGRFYTYDYSSFQMAGKQGQSSLAMNSLLANTLSGQINNMLSNAFHLENWALGTNLATGRMGWNDMEVEGMLSGSLLKNRLLIDGKFGYRDKTTSTYSNDFVGDFYLRYLLNKSGTISLKAYSETNDRYFTKSSLTTNGAGILFQRDFNSLRDFFVPLKKEGKAKEKKTKN